MDGKPLFWHEKTAVTSNPQRTGPESPKGECMSEIWTLVIRVRKEDSAFVYNVLEAHEGLASYTTQPHQVGEAHRDIELTIPTSLKSEAELMLGSIRELWVEVG